MNTLITFATTAALFVAAMLLFIRFAAMDPKRWHIDPERPIRSGKPNDFHLTAFAAYPVGDQMAGVYDLPFESLCNILQDVALAEPRTIRIAGDEMLGHITLVQRSALMGYPDAITIMTYPIDHSDDHPTSSVAIYSRSRYGNSDRGINRARVQRWLAEAAPFRAEPQPRI